MSGCKECKGTGNLHIDIPQALNKTFDLPCWFCGGTGLKGMTKDQIRWYRKQQKSFLIQRAKCLRSGRVEDHSAYTALKSAINSACTKLDIPLYPVRSQKSDQYGVSDIALFLNAEFKELERRLTAIPVAALSKFKSIAA